MPASKAQRAATAQRRTQAVQLRLAGVDYDTIADRLGYASRGAACTDINRALEANVAEQRRSTDVLRQEELQALDKLLVEATSIMRRKHTTVSHGRIVLGEGGQPIPDVGPVLSAIDRILKIRERRAKLLGLDAPVRHEVVTLDAVESEIRKLTAELGRAEAAEAARVEAPAGAEG